MAAAPAQVLLDVDFSHSRFERLRDLVFLRQTLDMTIGQLQVCYLRTVNLMEAGLLPVAQIETSLVNLAVSCSYFLVFVHLSIGVSLVLGPYAHLEGGGEFSRWSHCCRNGKSWATSPLFRVSVWTACGQFSLIIGATCLRWVFCTLSLFLTLLTSFPCL